MGHTVCSQEKAEAYQVEILRCEVKDNGAGIVTNDTRMRLAYSEIINNTGYALTTRNIDQEFVVTDTLTAEECTIRGNNIGVEWEGRAIWYPIILKCCNYDPERWVGADNTYIDEEDCSTPSTTTTWGGLKKHYR
jgi:hypothetical protein